MSERECPICHRVWTPSMFDDYMIPACGCYGDDHEARAVPCENCGIAHAWKCVVGRDDKPRLVTVDANGRAVAGRGVGDG